MTLNHKDIIETGGVGLSTTYHVNQPNILFGRITGLLETEKHQTLRTYFHSFPVLSKLH